MLKAVMKKINRLEAFEDTKTLWIFGAGASVEPYGVPTQARLLERFFNEKRRLPDREKKELEALRRRVFEICQRVQPGLEPQSPQISLEEVFSAYEIAMDHPRTPPQKVEEARNAIQDLLKAIRFITSMDEDEYVYRWNASGRSGASAPYTALLKKLYPPGCVWGRIQAHSFVTLNYDLHLDRALLYMYSPKESAWGVDLDYGIEFADYRLGGGFRRPREDRSALLLRPHGGLNWVHCLTCRAVFNTVDREAKELIRRRQCLACRSRRLDHILVHPSYLRQYSNPVLQLVWGRCQEELLKAERWVFVGYSLPAADVHFRELLRHSLRLRKKRKPEIIVVGKGPASRGDWKTMQGNYQTALGEDVLAWAPHRKGFAQFVEELS